MLICSAIQNNRCVLQPQHLTIISQVVHIFHKNHIWAYTISIFSKTYMYEAHMEICNLSYKRSLVMYLTQQININDLWNQTNFNLSFTHEPTINVLSGTSSGLHSTSTSRDSVLVRKLCLNDRFSSRTVITVQLISVWFSTIRQFGSVHSYFLTLLYPYSSLSATKQYIIIEDIIIGNEHNNIAYNQLLAGYFLKDNVWPYSHSQLVTWSSY
jgi:hypothetical protein